MPRQQYTNSASSNKNSNTHVPRFINHTGPIMQGSPHTPTQTPPSNTHTTGEPPKQSFRQLIKEGFAFGLGSTIGRNLVDSFFTKPNTNPSQSQSPSTPPQTNMDNQLMYQQCIKEGGNHETCKEYIV